MKTVMGRHFGFLKYSVKAMSTFEPTPRIFKEFKTHMEALWRRHSRKVLYK